VKLWTSGTVEVSGGCLAYHRTGGGGPVLVLSHGLTDNGLCWSRFAAAMERDFDVVMLDARGHGDSSRPVDAMSFDPGRDIAEAIDRLNLISPILMGHSVGARAAAACAGRAAGRVAKVILEDPPPVPPLEPSAVDGRRRRFRRQVEAFRAMTDAELLAMGKAAHPQWSEEEFPAWVAAKRQVDPEAAPSYASSWEDEIAAIAVPTLLVHGEADRGGLVTPEIAAAAVALNPNIRPVQIDGAGHNVRRENFTAFLVAVRHFLSP